jgi:hypothetical protein
LQLQYVCLPQPDKGFAEVSRPNSKRQELEIIVTALTAKSIIITAITASSSCAYAEADEPGRVQQESRQEKTHSVYSDFSYAAILVDDHTKSNRNNIFLAIDKNGRPALYPALRTQRCLELSQHTLTDVLAHWSPTQVSGDVYSFTFYRWIDSKWNPIKVELRFKGDYCSQFRVDSADSVVKTWLPANAIPKEVDKPTTGQKLKLPILVGLIEGPKDIPDCGIGGISAKYQKLLEQVKCPLGATK